MSREAIQKELRESHQWTRGMAEATRFFLRLIGGLVSLAFLWIILSKFVVPPIIESAYRGENLPILNDIISGQEIHPLEHYLASWEIISWRVLGILGVIGVILSCMVTWLQERKIPLVIKIFFAADLALAPPYVSPLLKSSPVRVNYDSDDSTALRVFSASWLRLNQ